MTDPREFSVLLVAFRTRTDWLEKAIESVTRQSYTGWELIIAASELGEGARKRVEEAAARDDRIRIVRLDENRGIAANNNIAAASARHRFLIVLDHDDELEPHALAELAARIRETDADVVYTDEDGIAEPFGLPLPPDLKPAWSRDSLLGFNYICHICCFRRTLFEKIGGFSSKYDMAQDYEFFLRISRVATRIEHVPKVLYRWRRHPLSSNSGPNVKPDAWEAGRRAVADHLAALGEAAEVRKGRIFGTYQVRYHHLRAPRVEVILPVWGEIEPSTFEGRAGLQGGARTEASPQNEPITRASGIRIVPMPTQSGWPKACNDIAHETDADILIFLHSAFLPSTEDWMSVLVGQAARPSVGACGPALVSRCGLMWPGMAMDTRHSDPLHYAKWVTANGRPAKLFTTQNVSGLCGAGMCTKRDLFLEVGGFREDLPFTLAGLDYGMKLARLGLSSLYVPFAELACSHDPRSMAPSRREYEALIDEWGGAGDPYMRTDWQ